MRYEMKELEEIGVSIVCLAYNAEKYIAQCLEGFLKQNCNFKYEIFVHDDASTDNTASIIQKYEKKYPESIHAIYQKENQYSKGVRIDYKYIYPYVKGKYIALCEGDDFWRDENKLQKQYDALEIHPECHMCIHRVQAVYEDGIKKDMQYPNFRLNTGVIESKDFIDYNCTNDYVFQTSSYFMLKEDEFEFQNENPIFKQVSATGDLARMFYFATRGDIFYIDDIMSSYRHGSTSSDARKEMDGKTEEKLQIHFNKQIKMMEEFDKYTSGKYHQLCERKINGYLFDKAVRNKEYKEMLKCQYKFFLKKYSVKVRIKLVGYAYFPKIVKIYDKLKQR